MKAKIFVLVIIAAAMVSFTLVKGNKSSRAAQHTTVGGDRNMADKNQFN
jgi:hypothetical protein